MDARVWFDFDRLAEHSMGNYPAPTMILRCCLVVPPMTHPRDTFWARRSRTYTCSVKRRPDWKGPPKFGFAPPTPPLVLGGRRQPPVAKFSMFAGSRVKPSVTHRQPWLTLCRDSPSQRLCWATEPNDAPRPGNSPTARIGTNGGPRVMWVHFARLPGPSAPEAWRWREERWGPAAGQSRGGHTHTNKENHCASPKPARMPPATGRSAGNPPVFVPFEAGPAFCL